MPLARSLVTTIASPGELDCRLNPRVLRWQAHTPVILLQSKRMSNRHIPLPPHFTQPPSSRTAGGEPLDFQEQGASRSSYLAPAHAPDGATATASHTAERSNGISEHDTSAELQHSSLQHVGLQDDGQSACCCVCTEPLELVAIGSCGHAETCARCCLKSRLNYNNMRCPVCAAEQAAVLIAPWQQEAVLVPPKITRAGKPTKAALKQHDNKLSWAPGVLVAKAQWYAAHVPQS